MVVAECMGHLALLNPTQVELPHHYQDSPVAACWMRELLEQTPDYWSVALIQSKTHSSACNQSALVLTAGSRSRAPLQ